MNPSDRDQHENTQIRPGGDDRDGGDRIGHASIHLPSPSIWPVAVAAGLTLFMFGVITHSGFVAAGLLLMLLGMARWIGELLRG